jgi:signal-transduction protein with cAMP-binding, CBS, and nucleotidyltransferase domain
MKLQEIMIRDVIQISPDESVGGAAKRMREKSVGSLVATIDGVIKGIITDRDLLACLAEAHDPYRCPVSTHMKNPVIALRPEDDHVTAVDVMRKKQIKRLPVVQRGKLLGMVSLSDLAAVAENQVEELWPSWNFITALVRTQAAQGQTLKNSEPQKVSNGGRL